MHLSELQHQQLAEFADLIDSTGGPISLLQQILALACRAIVNSDINSILDDSPTADAIRALVNVANTYGAGA